VFDTDFLKLLRWLKVKNSNTKSFNSISSANILVRAVNCSTRLMADGQMHIYKFKAKRITLNIYLSQHAVTLWSLVNGQRSLKQIQKEMKDRLSSSEVTALVLRLNQLGLLEF
jgi:hypothetical protein